MSDATVFTAGDRVARGQYEGTVIREYLPGMYEVRLGSGDVVVPAEELVLIERHR